MSEPAARKYYAGARTLRPLPQKHRKPGKAGARQMLLLAVVLLALTAAVAAVFFVANDTVVPEDGPAHLERLPRPESDSLHIVIEAKKGEFPAEPLALFADSATVSPGGSSPLNAVLPILDSAEESALVVIERENGFYMYGSFALSPSDRDALYAGRVPQGWLTSLARAEIASTDIGRAYQIKAVNISSPFYVEADDDGEVAYISDSLFDLERVREVRAGRMPGMAREWHDADKDGDWGGHMYISDGGIAKMLMTGADERNPDDAVGVKISWTTLERSERTLSETSPSGRARWSVTGVEKLIGKSFAASLKPHDWSPHHLFIPEPLIISLGLNLPDPGKNLHELPAPFTAVTKQLERLKLKPTEIRNAMTGPFSLSLGGRTQVLWFDLPGLVLDMPGRGAAGEVGKTLVDRFWAETFLGASPKPIDGYTHGGTTDLPFTVMAAANAETAIIGLTTPDVEHSAEMHSLLSEETSSIGWLFVDIPKLGSSISDMPTFGALLNDDEGLPLEEDVASLLRDSMSKLGRLFASFETAGAGKALWYH